MKIKILKEKLLKDFETREKKDYSLRKYLLKVGNVVGGVIICEEITDKDKENIYITDNIENIDKNLEEYSDEIEQFLTN